MMERQEVQMETETDKTQTDVSDQSEEKQRELRQAFTLFDKNHDGTIDPTEMTDVLRSLGLNPTETYVQDLINDIDLNENGMVDFDEFCNMMRKYSGREELIEAFKIFDTDGNGYINSEELRNVMMTMGEKMSDEDVNYMIKEFDLDKDGRLNYAEFAKAMTDA